MQYAVVIATRNRLEALRLSIPRMLEQSPPPSELIVVDSSDDHLAVARFVDEAAASHAVITQVVRSERGLTLQRNVGLALVTAPVVFFPDDDSIWFPGMAQAILAVYERDAAGAISAVCAYESLAAPSGFSGARFRDVRSRRDRVKRALLRIRYGVEDRFVPDPVRLVARGFMEKASLPEWASVAGVVPVASMTGFRMTFRTEVARRVGFDEHLTRYSPFEDRDASLGAWRQGAVVATPTAKVFHYRATELRDNGRRMGVTHLLNLAYVIAKHSPVGHPGRLALRRYGRYKCLLYRLAARDEFGRDRFRGAEKAFGELAAFLEVPAGKAAEVYNCALEKCLPD